MSSQRWIGGLLAALLLLVSSLGAVACGDDEDEGGDGGGGQAGEKQAAIRSNPNNKGTTITVGSKNFTEQKVLGEIYAQALEAAGYTVRTELNLGDEKTALKALESNEISAYPEYTGTALGSFFGVKSNEIPKDEQQAFRDAKAEFAKKNLTAYPPTPFTSSNEVGVTRKTADDLGLEKISDLEGEDQDLSLYGTPECRQREDCLLGLQRVYGLKFKEFKPVAIDLRHEVLRKGQADVSIVFTTDPQIQRNNFVLLEDDKRMFPPQQSSFVVRDDVAQDAGPDLGRTIAQASRGLTDEVMQELNARVDLDKKTPKQVASEYLKESGLVK
jgi:osmoprotectant transport system substrate-binding protein